MAEPTSAQSGAGVAVPNSSAALLPLLYDELRHFAAQRLAYERPGQTLQATALVHEAWLRLGDGSQQWQSQRHFFNAAAEAMRHILIDRARCKANTLHGGHPQFVPWENLELSAPLPDDELLALHEALDALVGLDPLAAELVKLRFFVGLPHAHAAEILGLNRSQADRLWLFARAWLHEQLHPCVPPKS